MKRAITSAVFVISFVSLLVLGLVSRVQAGDCSNASIKGAYGLICQGTVVGVGPAAVAGVYTADGNGNSLEVSTLTLPDTITPPTTYPGTYTVNADCTGTQVATGPDGTVYHNTFVIDDNKKEIRNIATDPGVIAVCIFRKQ